MIAWQGSTSSAEETSKLGQCLARWVRPGMLVSLNGELGAGKTQLAQGLLAGLGISEQVASPTYTLLVPYNGLFPVYHGDAYRIKTEDEVFELALDELLATGGAIVMEWGDRISAWLPPVTLRIELASESELNRSIVIETPDVQLAAEIASGLRSS